MTVVAFASFLLFLVEAVRIIVLEIYSINVKVTRLDSFLAFVFLITCVGRNIAICMF